MQPINDGSGLGPGKTGRYDSIRACWLVVCFIFFTYFLTKYFIKLVHPITILEFMRIQFYIIILAGIVPTIHLITSFWWGNINYLTSSSPVRIKALSVITLCLFGPIGWLIVLFYLIYFVLKKITAVRSDRSLKGTV